jgi:hypothetical protein
LENAVTKTSAIGKSTHLSVDGYELMKDNKQYVLHLTKSTTDEGEYIAAGVVYGKAPLEGNGLEFDLVDKESKAAQNIIKEVKEKYKNEKIADKYLFYFPLYPQARVSFKEEKP